MKNAIARLDEAFYYSAVWYMEKVDDDGSRLTDEQARNVDTFFALQRSVQTMSPVLKRAVIELAARNQARFERLLLKLLGNVCDRFRPATAAEFVSTLLDKAALIAA